MKSNHLAQIRIILEEAKKTIPETRTIFCLDNDGLIIDEIGLGGLGRDAARELVSLLVSVLGRARKLSIEILGDPWVLLGFIGSRSFLLLGSVGEQAILGLLVEASEGSTIKLPTHIYSIFSDYCERLATELQTLSAP